jgi:hypothetical protein
VIGAWRELEDAVVLAGVGAGAGRGTGSAAEVVELVQHRTGAAQAPLTELARIANAAAFGLDGTIRPQEVDRAWQISDETTTDLRRSASRARRWRWWVRIGPLRRR